MRHLAFTAAALLPLLAGCVENTASTPPATGSAPVVTAVTAPAVAPERQDFGIAPTGALRTTAYHAQTPLTAPGVRTVTTADLTAMLAEPNKPVLIDVLGGNGHRTLPGTTWLKGAGLAGSFDDDVQRKLEARAAELTGGDKTKPIVTFCLSEMCWLSYNAALRLAHAGYTNVWWYRGGHQAWLGAGNPTAFARPTMF
jgi:PQQ-dependent catabolism-associated CXXCW motif protein